MMKLLFLTLLMSLSLSALAKWADHSKTVCEEGGHCYPKCSSHTDCTGPEGCYEASTEDFEGAGWWQNMWRRDLGSKCKRDAQCESANCEKEVCDNSDKDGNCTSGHAECSPLKVCRKAQFDEVLDPKSSSDECEEGLFPDLKGTCLTDDSSDEDKNEYKTINIDANSCAMTVPSTYNSAYRFNGYMIKLFEYAFKEPQFGNDADCIGISKGMKHIAENLRKAHDEYGKGINSGLKEQEAAFYANIQNHGDVTDKNAVSMYMTSLENIKTNHANYKAQNSKLAEAYTIAIDDMYKLEQYYYGFNWKKDAVGNNSHNKDDNTTLSGNFRVAIRDGGKDYCRGRSPKLKNSWKRRYRVYDGVNDALAEYLKLPYHNIDKNTKRKFWLLDTPLPIVKGVNEGNDMFKHFGTEASDGGVRARMGDFSNTKAGSVDYMINVYGNEVYKLFRNDPTIAGPATGQAIQVMDAMISLFNKDKSKWEFLAPSGKMGALSEDDAKNKYYVNPKVGKSQFDANLKSYLDIMLAEAKRLNVTDVKTLKQLVAFHKLMWDFRSRFFLVQFMYSGSHDKRHPVTQRGSFFKTFMRIFSSNFDYLNKLNTEGHDPSIACLTNLSIKFEAATKDDDAVVKGATDYNDHTKNGKAGKADITKYKDICKGSACSGTMGANLSIPTFKMGMGKDSQSGAFNSGNLSGSNMSGFSDGINAINNARKKKADEALAKAGPAMKKAMERQRNFLKMNLTPPPAIASAIEGLASVGGNTGSTSDSTPAAEPEKENLVAAVDTKIDDIPDAPMKNISMDETKDGNGSGSEVTEEHAEAMLNEAKDEKYKSEESDNLFTKITKTYFRAGLPRLFQKKTELKNEEKEEFNPTGSKTKNNNKVKKDPLGDLN